MQYGDPLLDQLDIHNVVHHRLFRESCYNHQGNYVKVSRKLLGEPISLFSRTFHKLGVTSGKQLSSTIPQLRIFSTHNMQSQLAAGFRTHTTMSFLTSYPSLRISPEPKSEMSLWFWMLVYKIVHRSVWQ